MHLSALFVSLYLLQFVQRYHFAVLKLDTFATVLQAVTKQETVS